MITEEEGKAIKQRAEAWAAGVGLEDEAAFYAAVETQLNRLTLPPLA